MCRFVSLLVFAFFYVPTHSWSFEIFCLNVGQGDSTLVRGDNGKSVLIDAGGTSDLDLRFILQAGVGLQSLNAVIATHFDRDHIGNLDEAIRLYSPPVVYDHGGSDTTSAFEQYAAAAGTTRQTIQPGHVISLGDGKTTLTCIVSDGVLSNGASVPVAGDNDRSVGVLVNYEEFDFWVSGDLGGGGLSSADVESQVAPLIGDIEVLRINHHGSDTSSNQTFLETLMPELAVISVGGSNPFNHPTQNVLDRIGSILSVQAILQTSQGNAGTHELVRNANGHIRLAVQDEGGIQSIIATSTGGGFPRIEIPFSSGLSGDLDGNGVQDARDLSMLLHTDSPDVFLFSIGWHKTGVLPTPTPTRTFTPSFTPTPTPTGPTPTNTLPFVPRTPTPTPVNPGPTATATTGTTPGNTPTQTPVPTAADLRIQSAIPNPSGDDLSGREEIVLRNLSNFPANLTGYKIKDDDGNSRNISGNIAANGTVVFNPSGNILNNSGDTFWLEDPSGKILHQVSYTQAQAGDGVRINF